MGRLVPAVRRALEKAKERASRRAAEAALRRSEERHRALLCINNAIIANLDRDALFRAIADTVSELVPFDRLTIALYDRARDVLRVSALHGRLVPDGFGGSGPRCPGRAAIWAGSSIRATRSSW
jgi:transcriptional regulator with GAF, ATPase, and Fis domain